MCKFWNTHKQLLTVALALSAMMLAVIMAQAATPPPKKVAEPPVENKVTFDMQKNKAFTADDGIIVIPAPTALKQNISTKTALTQSAVSREKLQKEQPTAPADYTMPKDVIFKNGSLGVLAIPKIGLTVNVFETDNEMEAMTKGLAHFKTTSSFDSNVGLCGHNINFDLTDGYFKNLHKLEVGDSISYKTTLGHHNYTVETVKEISETDWSYLGRTEDNRITLITCISGKTNMRLVVQAVEK